MTFALGILAGIGLSIFTFIVTALYLMFFGQSTERGIKQFKSKVSPKGAIFEPANDVENWIDTLPNENQTA